mgnify:CR=1 FL=1
MRTTATFRLFGSDQLTAAAATTALGVSPTRSFEAGALVSSRSTTKRDRSAWLLQSSEEIEDDVELSTQLERLLVVLTPLREVLWRLIDQGYEANWFCYVESEAAEHAVELDRNLLERVLELPGEFWIDVG